LRFFVVGRRTGGVGERRARDGDNRFHWLNVPSQIRGRL
jgi:hypothetical protein